MEEKSLLSLVVSFAMIYGVFYFASKGWAKGQ